MTWKKGQSGNPSGRPLNPEIARFREALAKVEDEKRETVYEHAIRRSYKSDYLAKEILGKLIPTLEEMHTTGELKHDYGERVNEIIADIISRLPGKRQ